MENTIILGVLALIIVIVIIVVKVSNRKDNERLKYSALGLDNSTGAQTGPAQNMMQDPEFLYSLALTAFNSQHYEDAVKMALVAASKGSKSAENLLGACYENGYGVPVNQEMAIKFYTSSAEAGSADAQFNLGRLYYLISESKHYTKVGGMSVRIGPEPIVPYEEDVQAVKWFRKAAEQGSVKAQYSLGMCLYEGNGVERTAKNMEEGKHWLRKAAEQGFRAAEEYIAIKQI